MPGPVSVIVRRDPVATGERGDVDAVARVGVGDRVADEVAQDLREPVGVGLEHAANRRDVEVALAEQWKVAAQVLEEVVELDRLRGDQASGLGAGEREHVGDEPVHLVEPAKHEVRPFMTGPFVGGAVEQFDLRAEDGERGAELVGGI